VSNDKSLGPGSGLGGQLGVGGHQRDHATCLPGQQGTGVLTVRPRAPWFACAVNGRTQPVSLLQSEIAPLRRHLRCGSVQFGQQTHDGGLIGRPERASVARLAVSQIRTGGQRVPHRQPADNLTGDRRQRRDHELQARVPAQRQGASKPRLQAAEGSIGRIQPAMQHLGQVMNGEEQLTVGSIDRLPVMAAEANRQVAQRLSSKAPAGC
jgi:hypothetical protein